MPRKGRIISSSKIYHVVSRGNEKKPIFLDREDHERFIGTLRRKQKEKSFTLYAYCLMKSHYHAVLNEEEAGISSIMSSINTAYAIYFNKKYDRVGHLFQGRFRSEAIEDEAYFLTAVKYVHNNPVAAKLVNEASQYPWSSYGSYLRFESKDDLVECRFLLNMFSPNLEKSIPELMNFTNRIDDEIFSDHLRGEEENLFDKERNALSFIDKYLRERNMNFEELKNRSNMNIRNELIGILIEKSGLPLRRIGKLLGLSKNTISRAR